MVTHGYANAEEYQREFGLRRADLTAGDMREKMRERATAQKFGEKGAAHLELFKRGTPRLKRLHEKSLEVRRQLKRCSRGHLLDDANTYVYPNGRRSCRACQRSNHNRYNAEKAKSRG